MGERFKALDAFESARSDAQMALDEAEHRYLRGAGWTYSSSHPGGLWLWTGTLRGKSFTCSQATAVFLQRAEDSLDNDDDEPGDG